MAVGHEYGLELVAGRYLARIIFNVGDSKTMRAATEAVAGGIVRQIVGDP